MAWLQTAGAQLSASTTLEEAEQKRIDLLAEISPTVVCVLDENYGATGSGVIIDETGLGLTNFHVVEPLMRSGTAYGGLASGEAYPLRILGIDPTGDVAMFKLEAPEDATHFTFDFAKLGDSDSVTLGDEVYALGNPFGLAEDYTPTVTTGIVSGTNRYQFGANQRALVYTDCIQIDASISPGNSGGPLFDTAGEVIGINGRASFRRRSDERMRARVNVGVAYAISINQIKRFMPVLETRLLAEHGTLGATVRDTGQGKVIFDRVLRGSPAEEAGIDIGDELIAFEGRKIRTANDYLNILGTYPAGWTVTLTVQDGDEVIEPRIPLNRLPIARQRESEDAKKKSGLRFDPVEARRIIEAYQSSLGPPKTQGANEDSRNMVKRIADAVAPSVVKIYGAGVGDQAGYGSGVIVSEEGHVLTTGSLLLMAQRLRVVKHDGQLHTAELVDRDESLQLAVIRFEPESKLQPLTIETRISPRPGDSILAMGNPFKIAEGPEPISVTRGIVAGFTHLDAELGERPFPYRGEVMLLDAVTSNPGAAGGPVVDLDGNWVGLIGREVRSRLTNTFLNYGYRSTPVADYLNRVLSDSPTETTETDAQSAGPGYHGIKLSRFGYRRKLAFVANVKEGSPAETAGIQEGDLIVSANGTPTSRARVFQRVCRDLRAGEVLSLVIKRDEQVLSIDITLEEPR